MNVGYFLWKKFYQLFLTVVSIGLIIVLSVCIKISENDFFLTFVDQLKLFGHSLLHLKEMTVRIGSSTDLLIWSLLKEPFTYSFFILVSSFICTFSFGIIFSYFTYLLPNKAKKFVKECLFVIQSIPDVMVIFAFQLMIIWFYKKTNILLIDPIAGSDKVYILPIFFVSLLPGIMLFQMTFLAIEDESKKPYVEFARAKGLSHGWILLRHILRNVVVTLFSNAHFLFWFIISNQLVVEYLFNIRGYFYLLYQVMKFPDVFYVCLLILFLPFYFIEVFINFVSLKLNGKEQFE